LTPLVYDELRRLARNYMRAERGSHTLQATAVVHEAFLRLIQANVALQDRGHFFALASRLMRRVLVDHAKSRSRMKRNVDVRDSVSADTGDASPPMGLDVVALDDALEGLQQMEPRLAQVIELHYFGGMTYDQIAAAVNTSAATVHRDIRLARAWLLNEIDGTRSA
jgi:RNA polymerase sigma factor (TIGR02999 family)